MRRLALALVLLVLGACGLSAAQQTAVARTAATIASCEATGRACKADGGSHCYGEYDACMRDGGLRD